MRLKSIISLLLLTVTFNSIGQVQRMLKDTATLSLISKGLDLTYNFEFDEADKVFKEILKRYPDHPAYPQLMVMKLMVTLGMEQNEKEIKANWDKQYGFLLVSLGQSEKLITDEEDGIEGIFFMLNTRAMLAFYYSENGQKIKAVSEAQKAYKYMKKAMDRKDEYKEFYFASGIYNYYIERYPSVHPIIKPFMFFFRPGDMQLGLQELKIASRESVYSSIEALAYLVHIYGKYEAEYDSALVYSNVLVKKYPQNLNFLLKHAEQLVLTENYSELKPYIDTLLTTDDSTFFHLSARIFSGLVYEKEKRDIATAKKIYEETIAMAKFQKLHEYDYPLMAYAGLARILISEGKLEEAKELYKFVEKEAEYPFLLEEAKAFLKEN